MTKRKTLQVLALIGIVSSAATTYVVYRMSVGGDADDNAAQCWIAFIFLTMIIYTYLFVCIYKCDKPFEEDNPRCYVDCFTRVLIMELLLIIAFLFCLIGTTDFPF